MTYRIFISLGLLISALLWAGFGWHFFARSHVIPYDPPLRCLHVALPVVPGHTLAQTFTGRSHDLSGFTLAFRTTSAAQVVVEVGETGADGNAMPIAAATLQLPANHPFYTVHVAIPVQAGSQDKTYTVHLRGDAAAGEADNGTGSVPLAWSCWSDAFAGGELLVDGEPAHGDLFFQPLYDRGAIGAAQAIVARFHGIRAGVFPVWLWWLCLAVVLIGAPTLLVWAAGGRVGSLPNLIAVLILLPLVGQAVYYGDPRLHRPLTEANEAAVASDVPEPTTVNLLHELRKQAVGEIDPQETWDRHLTFAIAPVVDDAGERQLALRTSANTTVTWRRVMIPANASLTLRASVDGEQWQPDDGPLVVRVTATAGGETLLDVRKALITAQGDPQSLVHTLDLAAYAGRALTLTLVSRGDTRNSANMVVWSGLQLE